MKRLDETLNKILNEKTKKKRTGKKKKQDDQEIIQIQYNEGPVDIRDNLDSEERSQYQMGDADAIAVQVQHLFINGEFEKANELIKQHSYSSRNKDGFSWHHLQQLTDWVRSIYKYTDMKDLSKNYYDYQMKKEIEGVKDLRKSKVKAETVDKFIEDVKKVLDKKLKAH
jgi:hypothetical protein